MLEEVGQLWSQGIDCPCCLATRRRRAKDTDQPGPCPVLPGGLSKGAGGSGTDMCGGVVTQADGTRAVWEGALHGARRRAGPMGKEALG